MSKFPIVPFAHLFERVERKVILEDTVTYQRIGVRWYGLGAFIRDSELGMNISRKQQWVVESGDVIYNKLFAWKGSFAIAGADVHGQIASDKFPTYRHDPEQLDLGYLRYYFQTPSIAKQAENLSKGAAAISKLTLNPPQFWDLTIPLPPLVEQQRIVARIEALAGKIAAARRLREEARKEIELITGNWTQGLVDRSEVMGWPTTSLTEVCAINPSRKGQVQLEYGDQVSFVPMQAVDDITGAIVAAEPRPYGEVNKGHTWFTDGDVIFARITPCMQNGKAAVARNLVNGTGFGSTEFHVLRPDATKLDADFLYLLIRRPQFRQKAKESFKGTAGHQRVPESFFYAETIPLPPFDEQRSIVIQVQNVQEKVSALRIHNSNSHRELDALLPAILDRAFKGEL